MASKSRRVTNIDGAGIGPLNSVPVIDTSKGLVASAINNAKADYQAVIRDVLTAIKQFIADSDQYQLALDAKQSDMILGRIASLLDEAKDSFVSTEMEEMKKLMLDEISSLFLSGALKTFFLNLVENFFDDYAKASDIESLKTWIQENLANNTSKQDDNSSSENEGAESQQFKAKAEDQVEAKDEDNEKGDYKDSTPAENFYLLLSYILSQFDVLNSNLKNIPGKSGIFTRFGKTLSVGYLRVINKLSSIEKFTAKRMSKIGGAIGNVAKTLGKGVFGVIRGIASGVAAIGRGIKGVVSGIGKIGSKIGGAIASPFKKIGGFFTSLNPFKKNDKKADKKQKLKDRIMEKISNVIEKMWKVIEPFIDKVVGFMSIMFLSVVIPVALIAAKILLIVATLVMIGIGLYLVYNWIYTKVKWFVNYVTSGQLWEDIKAKLLAAWEWLKDIGGWIWNKFLDFGIWIWEKLVQFAEWLYTNYIEKYIVAPFKTYIWDPVKKLWDTKVWPMIEPFVKSLTVLKDNIVKAFSAWDPNKSIWENLKNIGSILKNSIVEWWNDSPFKVFYETYLKPFVDSAKDLFNRLMNLGSYLKNAILDWWNGDSSLGETLANIGTTVWNTIKDWWNNSIFKKYWDKLMIYLDDIIKPIKEWWKTSSLKKAIDKIISIIKLYVVAPINGIKRKIASFVLKLAEGFVIKIPTFSFNGSFNPTKWSIDWIEFHPFDFATKNWTPEQKQLAREDGEKSTMDLIKDEMDKTRKQLDEATNPKNKVDEIKQPNEAEQRAKAMDMVRLASPALEAFLDMETQKQTSLMKSGQEIAALVEEKENYLKLYYKKLDNTSNEILSKLNLMNDGINKKLDDPAVIPMYLPSLNSQYNNATMENN